jgi:hypothetical protein
MKRTSFMLGSVLLASCGMARADDHGCTVLLCLANPAGPMAVSECVPPIKKLYRDLAKGKAFPSCEMANAPDTAGGKSWAQHGASYYDQCPMGTTALEAGSYAMGPGNSAKYYLGIGEGDAANGEDGGALRTKTCVGKQVGETIINLAEGDGSTAVVTGLFDRVITVGPSAQPNYIDVYVNSAFLHRVRW